MMRFESFGKLAACAMLSCIATSSFAAPIGLTFEGLGNDEQILDFYGGGTAYTGSGTPGPDLGVVFNEFARARIDEDSGIPGANGNFANEPSPDTILLFNEGSAILNFAAGFDTGFSFFYSSTLAAAINVYPEINAGGTALATINLLANATESSPGVPCTGDPNPAPPEDVLFCNWDPIGVPFAGLARSIDFSGAAGRAGFDNVTFGAVDPVPLPAGVWLLASGLLGFAALRKRRRVDFESSVTGTG